jgi:mannose-6-phosphate isomerase
MASSDNVLRGGLTRKQVDARELLRVLEFGEGPVLPMAPSVSGPGVATWRPPVRDFELSRITLMRGSPPVHAPGDGPRIVFCLAGDATANDGSGELTLAGGQAAFVPAGRTVSLAGSGQLFAVTTGGTDSP